MIDEDEVEVVDEDGGDAPLPGRVTLMEALSKYLDPEIDPLDEEVLPETTEGVVARLLARFTPKFIRVKEGRYQVGALSPGADEHPLRPVDIKDFHIGQAPVTNELFTLFVQETGYVTDAERAGYGTVHHGRFMTGGGNGGTITIRRGPSVERVEGADWRHPEGPATSIFGRENHPVVQVSYRDAQAFAAWAGKRLPSEEEWEAAARGQGNRRFPWGNEWRADAANTMAAGLGAACAVDQFGERGKSPLGIMDMIGNVYEWTMSIAQSLPGPNGAPIHIRVLKGGCWNSPGHLTISHRLLEAETWSNCIGFRCAV